MKKIVLWPFLFLPSIALAFISSTTIRPTFLGTPSTSLSFGIRKSTERAQVVRFGQVGGEVFKLSRTLEKVRASGETIPKACELFNANLQTKGDSLMFEDVMALIDEHYVSHPIEFRNGDVINKQGENGGSAKLLSYAALSNLDKESTLKLWGQYYRDVLNTPGGDDHGNIRNFMKHGWEGVPFENGIALTRKNPGNVA